MLFLVGEMVIFEAMASAQGFIGHEALFSALLL